MKTGIQTWFCMLKQTLYGRFLITIHILRMERRILSPAMS